MISNGAKINAITDHGYSPLILALDHRQYEVAKELIAAGADISIVDVNGDTAETLAKKKGHKGILKLLEQAEERLQIRDKNTSSHPQSQVRSWKIQGPALKRK